MWSILLFNRCNTETIVKWHSCFAVLSSRVSATFWFCFFFFYLTFSILVWSVNEVDNGVYTKEDDEIFGRFSPSIKERFIFGSSFSVCVCVSFFLCLRLLFETYKMWMEFEMSCEQYNVELFSVLVRWFPISMEISPIIFILDKFRIYRRSCTCYGSIDECQKSERKQRVMKIIKKRRS